VGRNYVIAYYFSNKFASEYKVGYDLSKIALEADYSYIITSDLELNNFNISGDKSRLIKMYNHRLVLFYAINENLNEKTVVLSAKKPEGIVERKSERETGRREAEKRRQGEHEGCAGATSSQSQILISTPFLHPQKAAPDRQDAAEPGV
jgi:hypothetical protein